MLQPRPIDLAAPDLYINREISFLEFNRRVLAQAVDPRTPLLERLRFLTICSTNLDEFFEIRVAGLKQQILLDLVQAGPDGLSPRQVLDAVSLEAHELVAEQYRILSEELLPALGHEGIRVLRRDDWTPNHQRWVRSTFQREVLRVLSPMGLDPAHPFPRVQNKSLNYIVSVEGRDAFGRTSGTAVIHIPRSLPRLIPVPKSVAKGGYEFVLLSSIVQAHIRELFPGMTVTGCHAFRVTRNSDLWVDDEEVDDLLHALKGELNRRAFGDAVRLEVAESCPPETCQFLLGEFGLEPGDLYQVQGSVNLHRLSALPPLVDRPDLKYPPFVPRTPKAVAAAASVFDVLRERDVLLHHPFESFGPVLEFLRQSATDPNVLAIKMTVYRTGPHSPIADALVEAARAGKEVTAVIELRARFDEEANIDVATRLQEAGANVVYGVVGHKTHCKMLLVVRREGRTLRRYVHLGTGNYHPSTTRVYTDIGLLTASKRIAEDVHNLFLQLTGLCRAPKMRRVLHSPFTLHEETLGLIQDETQAALRGEEARIMAKMNAISEPRIIQALYRASQAGVRVDLIVRSICCLRPGIPRVSERIRVRSIVGRFLEHSRVFFFHAGGRKKTYLSSADWMERNLLRRVEVCVPIEDPDLARRVVDECFLVYLEDNECAWELYPDCTYRRVRRGRGRPRSAQSYLLEQLSEP